MTPTTLMLFAAGFGTRMLPLTATQPKPLIKVAGRALIDHALALARDAGVTRIVANLHYLPEQLERHLAGTGVIVIRENPEILETGGGLKHALPLLGDEPVFVLNTDAVWTGANPLISLAQAWEPERMECLQLVLPRAAATGYRGAGDWDLMRDAQLRRGTAHVYSGAHITRTDRIARHEARVFSLNPIWDAMIAAGGLFGTVHAGGWCDVGRPESIGLAEDLLRQAHV